MAALTALALLAISAAHADVVTDWNLRTAQIVGEARIGATPRSRRWA